MAARRLAISDLLCTDDEPPSPPNPVPQQAVVPSPPLRPLPSQLATILNDVPGSPPMPNSFSFQHPGRSTRVSTRDVVPLSLQPVQLRRHTPSPRVQGDVPGRYIATHAPDAHPCSTSSWEGDLSEGLRSAGGPSRSPEYDRAVPSRQHALHVDSPQHPIYARVRDPYNPAPQSHSTASYAFTRPSSSRSAHSSPSPAISSHSVSYTSRPHSPPNSPSSVYSLPPPQRRPSHSPTLSTRPVTASPISYIQPATPTPSSYPATHSYYDPVRSSLRGPGIAGTSSPSMCSPPSTLLPTSESRTSSSSQGSPLGLESQPATRGSNALSLPSILNNPSPSTRLGGGLGGLEALVQAATEERRRLSGELDGPGLSGTDGSPRLSRSPVIERASALPTTFQSTQDQSPSPSVLRTPSGVHREIPFDDIPVAQSRTSDTDGEPPRKKRRSSQASADFPPVYTQRPVTPSQETVAPGHMVLAKDAYINANSLPEGASLVADDNLRTTSIPMAPHELAEQTSDIETMKTEHGTRRMSESRQAVIGEQHSSATAASRSSEDKGRKKREKLTAKKVADKKSSERNDTIDPSARHAEADTKDQDAHEWLLEHYTSASPKEDPASSSIDEQASPASITTRLQPVSAEDSIHGRHHADDSSSGSSNKTKKERSRSPTPLAMLEEELGRVEPVTKDMVDDLVNDLVSPPPASSVAGVPQDDNDMDVDNELLSLLDDVPHAAQSSHRHKPTGTPRLDLHVRTKSPQPNSERGSMPPPVPPIKDGGKAGPGKVGDKADGVGAVAGHKKNVTQKPVAKSKAPPKPKTKVAVPTKTKSKPAKDAATQGHGSTPGVITPSMSALPLKSKKATQLAVGSTSAAKRSVSAAGGHSRSRSASVMPAPSGPEVDGKYVVDMADAGEEREQPQDDKLYCICKTLYDEDRVMIACDRCDEWYHTQCVNMLDLEVDLVDQFICPACIKSNPHLHLQTTYKKRCFSGLKHPNPLSPGACHKPARGTYSKYCSDECGILYMQSRIEAWGGDKDKLWDKVKDARKREGIVVRVVDATSKLEDDGKPTSRPNLSEPILEVVKPTRTKVEREKGRLNGLLDKVAERRDELKRELDVVLWREKLIKLASARADQFQECGWDQRLCFGDEEYTEFGAGVLESYEEPAPDAMDADNVQDDSEWWCRGKKKCDRHAGWQKLRMTEAECDKEILEGALSKLTTQEREIRKQIEDVMDPNRLSSNVADPVAPSGGPPLQPLNGKTTVNGHSKLKPNGETVKKGKKKT